MSYFHQIKTVKDEEQMLKKIISIQTQIRARREKERLARNSQNDKYTKIFEPITRTLKNLSDIPTTSTTTTLHPTHAENLNDFKDPTNLIDVKDNPSLPPPSLIPEDSDIKYDDDDDDLFLHIVRSIPAKEKDDGVFGLNIDNKRIGDNTFTVKGDVLRVYNDENGSEVTFQINDDEVWKLLLAQRPKQIMELKTF